LNADREESEALDALHAFVFNRCSDTDQFSTLTVRAQTAAEKRNAIAESLRNLLATY
jgi:hypothetical protein